MTGQQQQQRWQDEIDHDEDDDHDESDVTTTTTPEKQKKRYENHDIDPRKVPNGLKTASKRSEKGPEFSEKPSEESPLESSIFNT